MLAPYENARNTTVTALRMRTASRHKVPQPGRLFGTTTVPALKRIVTGQRPTRAVEDQKFAATA